VRIHWAGRHARISAHLHPEADAKSEQYADPDSDRSRIDTADTDTHAANGHVHHVIRAIAVGLARRYRDPTPASS
jgi:hypothetical protein